MSIKPIETVYNGYKFRSRLEARWAVFFDAMNIKYQYEPEGFDLDGTYYLPDFYLTEYEIYVEIKPFDCSVVHHVGDGNKWEQKCALFRDVTENAILLCYGEPASDLFRLLFAWDMSDGSAGSSEWEAFFSEKGLLLRPSSHDIFIHDMWGTNSHIRCASQEEWEDLFLPYDPEGDDFLNRAKTKARQARFEHGETPII